MTKRVLELTTIYDADFCHYDLITLREQLDVFINDVRNNPNPKFTNCHDIGHLAIKMVQREMDKDFGLVYRLIKLVLVLPVATASVERVFSYMKIIKTEFRNKMWNDWLNHWMTCYIERDVFARIKDEDILHHFQELKTRLIKLPPLPPRGASGMLHPIIIFTNYLYFAYYVLNFVEMSNSLV